MAHPTVMSRHALAFFLFALFFVPACGPHLRWRDHATRAFSVSDRCTQGPLVLDLPAAGARWGERIEVSAWSPRAILGRAAIITSDAPPQDVPFGQTRIQSVNVGGRSESIARADDHPENSRCMASAAELATAPSLPGAGTTPAATVPAGGAGTPSGTITVDTPAVRLVEPAPDEVTETIRRHAGLWRIAITGWATETSDPDRPPTLQPGARLRVRLWFPEPNDLEGVLFVVEHRVASPNVSDAEWVAHLRARIAEHHRADARAQAEYHRRNEHCAAHHEDEDCWGPGGYDAHLRRSREPRPQAVATVAAPSGPQPRDPDGPPPPPRVEVRPPKPALHADWVPGFWRWSGFSWAWISGRWRIPP